MLLRIQDKIMIAIFLPNACLTGVRIKTTDLKFTIMLTEHTILGKTAELARPDKALVSGLDAMNLTLLQSSQTCTQLS